LIEDIVLPQDKPITLCMYSGGLDSTAMLYKLLIVDHTPERHYHIHHVIIKNYQRRDIPEMMSAHDILADMKENAINPFTFSTSLIEYPTFNHRTLNDHDAFTFMAANMALLVPKINQVAYGLTKDDIGDTYSDRREKNSHIWNSIYGKHMDRVYPISHLTKRDAWDLLPSFYRRLTWSCREPVWKGNMAKPCGLCRPCKVIASFK